MGRRKSKSLLKLAFKRVPRKVWVPTSMFGDGYYKYKRVLTHDDGSTFRICESKDSIKRWEDQEKTLSLQQLGLQRLETGRIVPLKKV